MPQTALILLISLFSSPQTDVPLEVLPLEGILAPEERQDYQKSNDLKKKVGALGKALERETKELLRWAKQQEQARVVKILWEIRSICRHGRDDALSETNARQFRARSARKMEIRLRKLGETLDDIKVAFPYDFTPHFDTTGLAADEYRNALLSGYFGKSINGPTPSVPSLGFGFLPAPTTNSLPQRRFDSSVRGDQFTDTEVEEIRDAQELPKRVKVLLAIARARLDEIERRFEGREWEGEEDNPLEFYTWSQMVRAYHRALESMMINIDEKQKTLKKKELLKSLRLVNKSAAEFGPRLKPIRQIALEKEDRDLYLELRKAAKMTETALKGSQLGLGAPAN